MTKQCSNTSPQHYTHCSPHVAWRSLRIQEWCEFPVDAWGIFSGGKGGKKPTHKHLSKEWRYPVYKSQYNEEITSWLEVLQNNRFIIWKSIWKYTSSGFHNAWIDWSSSAACTTSSILICLALEAIRPSVSPLFFFIITRKRIPSN